MNTHVRRTLPVLLLVLVGAVVAVVSVVALSAPSGRLPEGKGVSGGTPETGEPFSGDTQELDLTAGSVSGAGESAAAGVLQLGELTGIRVSRHDHFDRVVLDIRGPAPQQVEVRYVEQLVEDGSGRSVDLQGPCSMEIVLTGLHAHDEEGNLTYTGPRRFRPSDTANVREIAVLGDFEGMVTLGVGLDHCSLFRDLALGDPTRTVIDVGH
ncbi:MAG TPA: hypothetical protein VIL00_01880 [Pseudonocardiaceae bacterium]|mgnify:CR=1 FL=1